MRIQKAGYFLVSLACAQSAFGVAPQILKQPRDQSVVVEQQAVFFVQASGSNLSFQWYKNGGRIDGATTDQLVFEHAHFPDNGRYSVLISNADGNVRSDEAALSARPPMAGDLDGVKLAESWIDGSIQTMAVQPDGKILIGGTFLNVHGASRSCLARLEPDGVTDFGFLDGLAGFQNPTFDPTVSSIAVQGDGRIVVGGTFFKVNGVDQVGLARLNPDGSLDQTFQSPGVNGYVYCIRQQADGKILVGGHFTSVNGVNRGSIARLLPNGALDTDFQNGTSGTFSVGDIAIQADGKIIIGGDFHKVNDVDRLCIARLNQNGTLDETFISSVVDMLYVNGVILDQNENILVRGFATSDGGLTGKRFFRLNHAGIEDTSFTPLARWEIGAMVLQPDNKFLFGASRNQNNVVQNGLFRMDSAGTIETLSAEFGQYAPQPMFVANGKILVATSDTVNGKPRLGVARLYMDGSLDESFANSRILPEVRGPVTTIVKQTDGKILVGGERIVRLDPALNIDSSFTTAVAGAYSIAIQSDQKILLGGYGWLGRLNADGSTDSAFEGAANFSSDVMVIQTPFRWPTVYAIAVQTDGKSIIGGFLPQRNIKRLTGGGSVDASFTASANAEVHALALQPDGMVLLGGQFTTVNNVPRGRVARVDSSGVLDDNFLNGLAGIPSGSVEQMVLQSDGKILVGGSFSMVNGNERGGLARLNTDGTLDESFPNNLQGSVTSLSIQVDGRIVVAGAFSGGYELAMLNSDGSIDSTFRLVDVGNASIDAALSLPDGNILVGGTFSSVNNQPALYLAQLWGTSPSVATVSQLGAGFNVEWNASAGKSYHLQYKDSLSIQTWLDVPGDPTLNGPTASKIDLSSQPQRFYRVVQD